MTLPLRKLIRNALSTSSSYLVIVLLNLLSTPYIVSKLGIEGYGIYLLLTSLVGYYSLLDLGFNQGVTKFIAEFRERNQLESVSRSINASLWVQVGLGLAASVSLVLLANPILQLLRVEPAYAADARIGILCCSVGFFFTMISGTFSAVLKGLQRFDLIGITDTCLSIALTVLILVLLSFGCGVKEVVGVTVLFSIVSLIIYFALVRTLVPEWSWTVWPGGEHLRQIFGFSAFMFLAKLSGVFGTYVVRFVISYFLGPAAVPFYVIPARLLAAFGGLLGSAAQVIFPLSSQLGVSDRERLKEVMGKGSRILAALSMPVFLYVIVFSYPILSVWMGVPFAEKSYLVLSIITLSSLVAAQTTVPNLIVSGLGHSGLMGFLGMLAVGCYLVLLPVLTKAYGLLGTSVAMLLTTLINVGFAFRLTTRKLGMPLFAFLRQTLGVHVAPVIVSLLGFSLLLRYRLQGNRVVLGAGSLLALLYFWMMVRKEIRPQVQGAGQGQAIR